MLEKMHDNISASITNKTAYSTCSMPERRVGEGDPLQFLGTL